MGEKIITESSEAVGMPGAVQWRAGATWLVRFDGEATPTLDLAADELATFARTSCGVRVVREPAAAGAGVAGTIRFGQADIPGYRVDVGTGESGPGEVTFCGANAVSILYAVYAFAEEHLGYCFFEPGRDRCHPVGDVAWPAGTVTSGAPVLRSRGFIQEYPPDARSRQLADWMARNRMNQLLTWMEHYDQYDPELIDHFAVRGVEIESGHHNFEYLVPLAEHYDEHPEYFAEIGGHRVGPDSGDEKLLLSKQICATNPDVRQLLAEQLLGYAAEHPEVTTLSLVPNDGFGWCECEACTALVGDQVPGRWETVAAHVHQSQGLYHDLVSDVADRVTRQRPDLKISFFAYVNYLYPAPGFVVDERLIAYVAFYWRCINHDLGDAGCPTNAAYVAALAEWGAADRGGQVNVYEYYMGVNLYLSLPMVHHTRLADEVQLITERGGDGVLTQFSLDHWAAYGLNYYAFARAAWGESADEVLPRWSDHLFGRGGGATAAADFLSALDTLQRDPAGEPDRGGVGCLVPVPKLLLGQRSRSAFDRVLAAAERLAERCPDEPLATAWAAWARYLVRLKDAFDANAAGVPAGDRLRELLATVERDAAAGHHYAVAAKVDHLFGSWLRSEAAGERWGHSGIDWEDRYVERREAEMVTARTAGRTAARTAD
ncbi:DUF4838 domain-containing protein [Propionibacteriaceae bacterium Y2011]